MNFKAETDSRKRSLASILPSPIIADVPDSGAVDPFRLENQVAVVTGGGTGLGYAIAESITNLGGQVAIVGRREDVLYNASDRLGKSAVSIVADVTTGDAQQSLYEQVAEHFGPPTILVNNAGIHLKRPATETRNCEFSEVLETHATAAFALSREFGRHMAAAGSGSILFIASMAAVFGIPQVTAYSAAKSAQLGLVRSLAVELSPHGVRVNAIAPGWIETPMSRKAFEGDPDRKRRIIDRTPMRRLGCPEEVGRVAAFLCSPAASFISGAVLHVDGGVSIGF